MFKIGRSAAEGDDKMDEKFRDMLYERFDIAEYYEINPKGEIRNKNTGQILRLDQSSRYPSVRLTRYRQKNSVKHHAIHRLLHIHFGTTVIFPGMYVHHKDDDKTNFNLDNLEWKKPKDNSTDAAIKNLYPNGERAYQNIYPEHMIRSICQLLEKKYKPAEIINELGLDVNYEIKKVRRLIKHLRKRDCWNIVTKDYHF